LGLNHVERQCLYAGFSVQRIFSDYGYDANIFTYNEAGETENGMILIQLKSTDNLQVSKAHNSVEFSLSKRDLELWLFIIYDAAAEKAYYVVLQEYFKKNRLSLQNVKKFIQIRVSLDNIFTSKSIQQIREIKNAKY